MANGKWQVANYGALRAEYKASQGVRNSPIEQILKGGVPLFEERGTAFRFVVFLENLNFVPMIFCQN